MLREQLLGPCWAQSIQVQKLRLSKTPNTLPPSADHCTDDTCMRLPTYHPVMQPIKDLSGRLLNGAATAAKQANLRYQTAGSVTTPRANWNMASRARVGTTHGTYSWTGRRAAKPVQQGELHARCQVSSRCLSCMNLLVWHTCAAGNKTIITTHDLPVPAYTRQTPNLT